MRHGEHYIPFPGMRSRQCRYARRTALGRGSEIACRWRWPEEIGRGRGAVRFSTMKSFRDAARVAGGPVEQASDRRCTIARLKISSRGAGETLSKREENERNGMGGAWRRLREAVDGCKVRPRAETLPGEGLGPLFSLDRQKWQIRGGTMTPVPGHG